MELNLLEKTEIHIRPVKLDDANLGEISRTAARVLGLPADRVQVIDVREDSIALDVLKRHIKAEQVFGKGKELLGELAKIRGLTVFPETSINSSGILGYLELAAERAKEAIKAAETISREIRDRIAKRAIVFPSGFEVRDGLIEDTNTPYLVEQLQSEGFKAVRGKVLPDDLVIAAARLNRAVDEGYGLIITTGGVGAEDKDFNIEALSKVADDVWTPYIIKFNRGEGRHVKDGVRIGVGQAGLTTIVNLPGPHEEVRASFPVVRSFIRAEITAEKMAEKLAEVLRKRWEEKFDLYINKKHINDTWHLGRFTGCS
ncbi:MAG: molybdopterin-binding protein [Peptococcaceae bacterium]|nr:molybdopterin-binding protein [Peptococcaceae bacterium]MDH7524655.1 molybdopterin-binding protein [Peptococcaceae bacterium]